MKDASSGLGLRDMPISGAEDESLGLKDYANVLSRFVRECDTPITVALQGDWGSGKTSLMNLIKEQLDSPDFATVWFNTWQYAQFNLSDTLALSMMSHFIDRLSSPDSSAGKTAKALLGLARAVAVGGASVIGHGDTIKTMITELEPSTTNASDPTQALESLKNRLGEIVEEKTIKQGVKKIIVFIDDIDRLVPIKAVELLEALKIFLDIPHCVYIIACDYSVVVTGLKSKFGVADGELKGKSFFDKIIQVPFKMPIRRYEVDTYIKNLLRKIGIEASEEEIGLYRKLVEHSVGFNPRTMKRLINSLLLLKLLAETKRKSVEINVEKNAILRVLFGMLCMQERYEPLYDHIREEQLSEDMLKSLRDNLARDPEFQELRERLGNSEMENDSDNAQKFMDAFYKSLQLDDDESLSRNELEHLQEVIKLSATVSVGTGDDVVDSREQLFALRRMLNNKFHKYVEKLGTHTKHTKRRIGRFRKEGNLITCKLPKIEESSINIEFDSNANAKVFLWLPMDKEWDDLVAQVVMALGVSSDVSEGYEGGWLELLSVNASDGDVNEQIVERLIPLIEKYKLWEICNKA